MSKLTLKEFIEHMQHIQDNYCYPGKEISIAVQCDDDDLDLELYETFAFIETRGHVECVKLRVRKREVSKNGKE